MDRRLLFPAIAATAWAQQPSQPATEALRDRVQQYYQMMVDKKFRQAEALVAEESKEDYYAGKKPDIKNFEIMSIDLQADMVAKVTIKAKLLMLMPGAGAQVFDFPTPTYWKIEKGVWCWYVPAETKAATPFGKMVNDQSRGAGMDMKGAAPGTLDNPDVGSLLNKIGIDRVSVVLSEKEPVQLITITNGLPGPLDLIVDAHVKTIKNIVVDVTPLHLEGGAKAVITVRRQSAGKVADYVAITAQPFRRVFNIQVVSE
jgi:hypothetical protein